MTRVCLVGDEDVSLRYELLSRETSRDALSTYDLRAPYENTIALETVSLGAAVSLLNDLNWYLIRFVDDALVLEPSINDDEWLSRDLALGIRDDAVDPDETGQLYKVYGVQNPPSRTRSSSSEEGNASGAGNPGGPSASGGAGPTETVQESDRTDDEEAEDGPEQTLPRLVEPMYVTRTAGSVPEYDIRDVDGTLRVRVTESEFEA